MSISTSEGALLGSIAGGFFRGFTYRIMRSFWRWLLIILSIANIVCIFTMFSLYGGGIINPWYFALNMLFSFAVLFFLITAYLGREFIAALSFQVIIIAMGLFVPMYNAQDSRSVSYEKDGKSIVLETTEKIEVVKNLYGRNI